MHSLPQEGTIANCDPERFRSRALRERCGVQTRSCTNPCVSVARGHDRRARDPDARPDELAPGTIELPSVPLRCTPRALAGPTEPWVFDTHRWEFDLCFAQTTSMLLEFGVWLARDEGHPPALRQHDPPRRCYDVLLPERLAKWRAVHGTVELTLKRPFEGIFADI